MVVPGALADASIRLHAGTVLVSLGRYEYGDTLIGWEVVLVSLKYARLTAAPNATVAAMVAIAILRRALMPPLSASRRPPSPRGARPSAPASRPQPRARPHATPRSPSGCR